MCVHLLPRQAEEYHKPFTFSCRVCSSEDQRLVSVFVSSGFYEGSETWGDAPWFLDDDNIPLHGLGVLENFFQEHGVVLSGGTFLLDVNVDKSEPCGVGFSGHVVPHLAGAILGWDWGMLGTIEGVVLHFRPVDGGWVDTGSEVLDELPGGRWAFTGEPFCGIKSPEGLGVDQQGGPRARLVWGAARGGLVRALIRVWGRQTPWVGSRDGWGKTVGPAPQWVWHSRVVATWEGGEGVCSSAGRRNTLVYIAACIVTFSTEWGPD